MNEILKKMSSYNIFNYLFTGVIFLILAKIYLDLTLFIDMKKSELNIIINLFWAYFIGLTVSRIGSLVIEKIVKLFIKFKDYSEFIEAEKIDSKISTLSEQNNVYRSLAGVFLSLLIVYILIWVSKRYNLESYWKEVTLGLFFIVYLVSYIKQTNYIIRRIDKALKKGDKK